ncbi:hypothetical protein GXW74_08215 [Roseomonas eburnea]|uniref:Uncharacterized protein n=1 Tax=Neoroseomonas eburnea TaxID=1346889 RepID=A0A9X9X9T2_9PROT|nr:hypothetical protein [Neoroseomonas eburnea]MBR0680468.1 hypothetical protein [Neoroseomonas eburnea]
MERHVPRVAPVGPSAAVRPASIRVQANPAGPAILYAVPPRLQTGSPGGLPMIVTSFGAERQRADGTTACRAMVIASHALSQARFARATTRRGDGVPVQVLAQETRCGSAGGCLFVEALRPTFPADALRQSAESGTPWRSRLTGSAAFVEVGIPPGHVRAPLEPFAGWAPRQSRDALPASPRRWLDRPALFPLHEAS